MQKTYITSRLYLNPLNPGDTEFIFELLNTEGWIKFIGDRNIQTTEDSQKYIQKILDNPDIMLWVAKLKEEEISIGLISFIKRDFLDHHDIGFAFLPAFSGKGYALEATEAVLNHLLQDPAHNTILATVKVDNKASVRLIGKLGFHFSKEIENEEEKLLLYSMTAG
jgi:[ribosomal protein S5]-alanine N-acetyltransferase